MATAEDIGKHIALFERELEAVMAFWTAHSHDSKHGGFLHCLTESGEVFDTIKYGWVQGRQVWMYAKLYNNLPTYKTPEILEAAVRGGEFLLQHVKLHNEKRCYFAVTEEGKPLQLQRKPYTELFFTMAMTELYRATGDSKYQEEATAMLSQVIHWIRVDDSGLGRPKLAGASPSQELGRPLILLNVLNEFCGDDETLRKKYAGDLEWCVQAVLNHHDGQWVREHVSPEGNLLPGSAGRLTTPGHAIEAGWFLLQEARARGDVDLQRRAISHFIEQPCGYGWDKEHGGLFYFLDVGGHSPVQLEWSMKLWWVHSEALVAWLMAYQSSGRGEHWKAFVDMCQYTFSKFSDPKHGEWYGYLTREGKINQTCKGGPFKGCFHIPRSLLYCLMTLRELHTTST